MANFIERLTEGTVFNNRRKEVAPLLDKWSKFGLLEGFKSDVEKENMSILLENQAKQILKESAASANSLSNAYGSNAGDIQGYAAVAFPLVRRVFGSLIANDLVSVQPMSLPSGLVFFLDFVRNDQIGMTGSEVYKIDESIYGGGRLGAEITKGIKISGQEGDVATGRDLVESGLYSIAHGYHRARASALFTGSISGTDYGFSATTANVDVNVNSTSFLSDLRYDADLLNDYSGSAVTVLKLRLKGSGLKDLVNEQNVFAVSVTTGSFGATVTGLTPGTAVVGEVPSSATGLGGVKTFKRLAKVIRSGSADERYLVIPVAGSVAASGYVAVSVPVTDNLQSITGDIMDPGAALGLIANKTQLEAAGPDKMPELRIQVNSLMINTESRKLRASWTPELSQDLNAYHNIDAEVELTNLLSEQISQELDQLLLNDLLKGATAGTFYWSRRPGKFVNRATGAQLGTGNSYAEPPDFTGNVSMWYETLIETVNDLSAQIMRKTLRGGATFLVCGPEVANILEFTAGFRASATHSEEKGTVGVVNVGSISKKFDVMVSTYFPRNVILVGRKGSGFLESGYVYAPYVPLQMTPTVFDPDNFTPRKAVMTRFGRKMVRPDMYGLVIVQDLLG